MMLCKKGNVKDIEKKGNNWIAERKYDGVRCMAMCRFDEVKLFGRSGKDYTNKFPELVEALKKQHINCIFDGEICAKDFGETQSRVLSKKPRLDIPVTYYIFDVLMDKPLRERKQILREMFYLHYPLCSVGEIAREQAWELAEEENWEGIILKNLDSYYEMGKRSSDWLKVKRVKSKDLEFSYYEMNNAGIRATSKEGIVCQIGGKEKSEKFLEQIKKRGVAIVEVEYLEEFSNGKLRMPVCKEVKDD